MKTQISNDFFTDRIIIKQILGQGYRNTFLNGIQILGFNGQETELLVEKTFRCFIHEKLYVISELENMVKEFLKSQAVLSGSDVDDDQLETYARSLVAESMKNQPPFTNQLNS